MNWRGTKERKREKLTRKSRVDWMERK